jgi:DNA-directed RNA polymerase subunit omega
MNMPQGIDSKFRFILVAARRARQLQAGAKPMVQTQTRKITRVAQLEVEAGLVPFEDLEVVSSTGNNAKKQASAK